MFVNRAVSEEPTYRQMIADQTNLALNIEEFRALDEINTDEVAAGQFKVPYWEVESSLQSDSAYQTVTSALAEWLSSQAVIQKGLAEWSTENAQQPTASGWKNKLSAHHFKILGGLEPSK